jgi:hypothetical protein
MKKCLQKKMIIEIKNVEDKDVNNPSSLIKGKKKVK